MPNRSALFLPSTVFVMPVFHVARLIRIDSDLQSVYPHIRDFRKWPSWSPWLLAEPDCRIDYAEDGKRYSWKGKIVGSGEMELLEESEERRLHYRLTFLEPWKSENSTTFTFEPEESGVKLTWTMEGTLPWFMFWMRASMENFIGMDYDRGLRMLKDLGETGRVPSQLAFRGVEPLPARRYVGIREECAFSEIGERMSATFERLRKWSDEGGHARVGAPFALYHKWKVNRQLATYTVACPLEKIPTSLPSGFTSGEHPAHSAYVIEHTGAYRHLGNAWAAGMMHGRSKRFAKAGNPPPCEIYDSDPATVSEDQLVTRVVFPAKG